MQVWPRKRAKGTRVRSWAASKDAKPLGFAGYKVGMTHVIITDNRKTSTTKGKELSVPVTLIECPPLKVASIRFYKHNRKGTNAVSDILAPKLDKELAKTIVLPKKPNKAEQPKDYDDLVLVVYTQPKLTGIGKKKPEVFELAIGGSKEDKLKYANEILGKEINLADVFKEGEQIDVHAITKGKGFQGPVKRFGIGIRSHKSEKTKRGPGSLGGWSGQGHFMYRVAHAGQTGYHLRLERNKWILKLGLDPKEANIPAGFTHYGNIKNNYLIVKGSVAGPAKRFLRLTAAVRPSKKRPAEAPAIEYISKNA